MFIIDRGGVAARGDSLYNRPTRESNPYLEDLQSIALPVMLAGLNYFTYNIY